MGQASADYTDYADDTECRPDAEEGSRPVDRRQKSEGRAQKAEVQSGLTLSYIADTRCFLELAEHYRADVVIMNVVRPKPSDLDHLHAPDAEALVKAIRPKLAVLSHFGMRMLAAKPWVLAREMSERTGCQVVAASDGMLIDLEQYKTTSLNPQAASADGEMLWGQPPSGDGPPSGGAE
jgi:hypothetical protein